MRLINILKSGFNIIHYFRYGGVSYARKIGVTVGERCRIHTRNFGSEPFLIKLGNDILIAPGVNFITHDGAGIVTHDDKGRRYYYAPIYVGNNVMIGLNSIILAGVKIDDNVIIAAGSVVTHSIPANSIVGGVPARIIGNYTDFKARALNHWPSEREMDYNIPFEERIRKIVDNNFKPYIK